MREVCLTVLVTLAAAGAAGAQEQAITADRWQETLQFAPGAERRLEIDNIWGSIDVVVHDGPGVDVLAQRHVTAETPQARDAAAREVRLLVTDHASTLRLYVDGPFRGCDCGDERRDRRERRRGRVEYEVRYEFEVRVPRGVAVDLRTVNDGAIRVRGVDAGFEVHNVNGGIELHEVAGAGVARTVNGDIDASFRANPSSELRLVTLNGDVVARFAPRLSADVWVKTFNGDVFTDYEFSALPVPPPETERKGSTRVWRTSRRTGVRIGQGGPSFEFETFNGDIRILRSQS